MSHISYVTKLVERTAVAQIEEYLIVNNLLPQTQSTYRVYHSVETALFKVQSVLLFALDGHKEAFLILLNFSAVFDTIDHQILLQRLIKRFGFTGKVLQKFCSSLATRTHAISINEIKSDTYYDNCGIAQGAVMGLIIIFTMYIAPVVIKNCSWHTSNGLCRLYSLVK